MDTKLGWFIFGSMVGNSVLFILFHLIAHIVYKSKDKPGPNNNLNLSSKSELVFSTEKHEELLRFEPNGNIFVYGKLISNDMEVVDGMREIIRTSKINGN